MIGHTKNVFFLLLMKLVSSIGFYVPDNVAWSHFQIYLLKSI